MKKLNNKGFSLVELIIVIAIMAVLVAVLAPQYIQYVERSRVANDKNTASAIEQAINVLCADGTIKAPAANPGTVVLTWDTVNPDAGLTDNAAADLNYAEAVVKITGTIGEAQSSVAQTAESVVYTVTFTDGVPAVVAAPLYQTAWN